MRPSIDLTPVASRSAPTNIAVATLAAAAVALAMHACGGTEGEAAVSVARPALTVSLTTPRLDQVPIRVSANGNIMAWQEASIGTEVPGLRLVSVDANVGDVVRRGQVLATFAADTAAAELAQGRAALAEAEATLVEAADNARRARGLQSTGAMSMQQINQYLTAERTAQARVAAARAAERAQQLRLAQTRVLASDDGVISARSATVGAVFPAGQELFRLIRRGRLEWRAEVAAAEVARLKPGQIAHVTPVGGETIAGTVRVVAPTVDTQTRNGLAYVDLPLDAAARAGMFARGEIDIGTSRVMTLPQSAVLLRDGYSYVMSLGANSTVSQTRVTAGRRLGDRIEIVAGIEASTRVVASGAGFLGDGDLVRVVVEPPVVNRDGQIAVAASSAAD